MISMFLCASVYLFLFVCVATFGTYAHNSAGPFAGFMAAFVGGLAAGGFAIWLRGWIKERVSW